MYIKDKVLLVYERKVWNNLKYLVISVWVVYG